MRTSEGNTEQNAEAREEAYLTARSTEHQFNPTHVRAAAIVPNYARITMARAGMYSDLNPVFNEVCPPHHMDENIFQQHQHMAPPYPQQYNSPADPHNQQMPLVPYGAQATDHRAFSPGMSGSAGDLRNMGIPSHVSNDGERHFSPSPGGGIGEANKPENSWMVTTSHIDMRTVTPPNAVVTHSMLHQSPGLVPGQNHSVATISHTGFPHGGASSSTGSAPPEQKPRLTKSGKPRGTPGRKRKVEDHDLSPEEAAKRRLRRERNKLAAAKCRNRRRELTDRLQGETDILEDHQGMLTQEIFALQQEKDHLEFLLASHSPVCKVLQDKSLNLMGNQSPKDMQCLNSNNDCMALHNHGDHGANLVNPMNGCMTTSGGMREQATTVSVIQAGPSLNNTISRGMNENIFPQQGNSVIVGNENMMHGSYAIQAEDLRSVQEEERRFPATLANLDVLDQVVAGEPLNTPVCTLSTPSNTTSVFTFPNTPCATSNSMANNNMNFNEAFTTADYSSSQTSSVMSGGNFLHPGPYPSSSIETCSQAHRRSSSSESHHSPDSVQSPTLLSL